MVRQSQWLVAAVILSAVTLLAQRDSTARESKLALSISSNGRYFAGRGGEPAFLTGDTAWRIVVQLKREEMLAYLDKRREQGFNTILFIALPWADRVAGNRNAYGDEPFHRSGANYDPAKPDVTPNGSPDNATEYDYWDHVDFFVQAAERKGFYLAFLPCWGDPWVNTEDSIFTQTSAYAYGQWVGARYRRHDHILWVLGGDTRPEDKAPVYRAMAEGLADGTNGVNNPDGQAEYGTTLMTYHEPKKWTDSLDEHDSSATWFHNDPWLDFNSCQEHPEKAARAILGDFVRKPVKPVWLFEGRYEAYQRDSDTPPWDAWSIRYQAYQSVFSGGFGHVYGHEGVFSFGLTEPHAADVDWRRNLEAPGAQQVGQLAKLMKVLTPRQYWSREPAQELIASRIGVSPLANDPREGNDRISATRAADGSIAMVYIANGRSVSIRMDRLAGPAVDAYWYNPRNGQWRAGDEEHSSRRPFQSGLASGEAAGALEFDPPGAAASGNDWVLVLSTR